MIKSTSVSIQDSTVKISYWDEEKTKIIPMSKGQQNSHKDIEKEFFKLKERIAGGNSGI